jgi:hypothetical protein
MHIVQGRLVVLDRYPADIAFANADELNGVAVMTQAKGGEVSKPGWIGCSAQDQCFFGVGSVFHLSVLNSFLR